MRLEISRGALEGIRAAAAAAHPLEACGLLFGEEGLIDGQQTTANVATDPETGFEIDPGALFAALRADRAGERRLRGYWHSHPNGSVDMSSRDRDAVQADGKVWVIVAGDDIAAWRAEDSPIYDRVEHNAELRDGEVIETINYTSSGATMKTVEHVPLKTGEIRHLVPRDKCDVELIPWIAEAGYPAIAPILDDLMIWTADPNWPIAILLIDYLKTLGEPMIEPIRNVFRGDDDDHKFVCLRGMVREFPLAVQELMRDDLCALAATPCPSGWDASVDEEARTILGLMDEAGA